MGGMLWRYASSSAVQRGGGWVAAVAFEQHRGRDVEPLDEALQQGEHGVGTGSVCVSW